MTDPYREGPVLVIPKIRRVLPTWLTALLVFAGFGIGAGTGYTNAPHVIVHQDAPPPTPPPPPEACKDSMYETLPPRVAGCDSTTADTLKTFSCGHAEHRMKIEFQNGYRRVSCFCTGHAASVTIIDAKPAGSAP